ncbi:MAG: TolC family protein [Treponemataceae bacterium]
MSKISKKSIVIGFLFYNFVLCIWAQQTVLPGISSDYIDKTDTDEDFYVLTVDKAVEIAFESNFSLKQNKISMEQSSRNYKSAWNLFLPNIGGTVSVSENAGFDEKVAGKGTLNTQILGTLALNTALGPKIKLLKNQYQNGILDYQDAVRKLECEVRSAFYYLLFLEDQLKMYKKSLDSYQVQYDQTKIKKENGLVPELDLFSALVNLESAKTDLKDAEKTYINALLVFINQICFDVPEGKKIKIEGELKDCDRIANMVIPKEKISEYVQNCPAVRSLAAKLDQTRLTRLQTINAGFVPTLNLSAGIIPYTVSNIPNSSASAWSGTLSLSIPISNYIPSSSTWNAVKDLDDSIEKLSLSMQDTKRTVTTQVYEMLRNIDIYKQTLEGNRMNVELAKKTFEMAQDSYNRGTKDLLYLEKMGASYKSAELKLSNQEYVLIKNVYALRNLLGLDMEESNTSIEK